MGDDFVVVGHVQVSDDGTLNLINGQLNAIQSASGGAGNAFSALGSIANFVWANVILAGINAAVSAIKQFATDTVGGAEDIQNAQAQIANALSRTGSATGLTMTSLQDLAMQLQKNTTYSYADALGAENLGLKYTNLSANIFPAYLTAAANLATMQGMDLPSAADTLGKALEDPINGFGRLTMVIGQVPPALKSQVEAMAKSGDVAGADALIIQTLNQKMGGDAYAATQTFSGAWKQLTDELSTNLQTSLLPMLSWATDFMKSMDGFKGISFQDIFKDFGAGGLDFQTMMKNVNWKQLTDEMLHGITSIDWGEVGLDLRTGFKGALSGLWDMIKGIDWGSLFAVITVAFVNFVGGLTGAGNFSSFLASWQNVFTQMGITVSLLKGIVSQHISEAVDAVKGTVGEWIMAGENLIEGLIGGVAYKAGAFVGSIVVMITKAIDAAKSAAGVHSPSTEFNQVGVFMIQGLADGLTNIGPITSTIFGWYTPIENTARGMDKIFFEVGSGMMEQLILAMQGDVRGVITEVNSVISQIKAAVGGGVNIPVNINVNVNGIGSIANAIAAAGRGGLSSPSSSGGAKSVINAARAV